MIFLTAVFFSNDFGNCEKNSSNENLLSKSVECKLRREINKLNKENMDLKSSNIKIKNKFDKVIKKKNKSYLTLRK